jgi:hypothetical protein
MCAADECTVKFVPLLAARHHCRFCGLPFCEKCVFQSVLVYIDQTGRAVVTLLSAGNQPAGSELLNACSDCYDALKCAIDFEVRRLVYFMRCVPPLTACHVNVIACLHSLHAM